MGIVDYHLNASEVSEVLRSTIIQLDKSFEELRVIIEDSWSKLSDTIATIYEEFKKSTKPNSKYFNVGYPKYRTRYRSVTYHSKKIYYNIRNTLRTKIKNLVFFVVAYLQYPGIVI